MLRTIAIVALVGMLEMVPSAAPICRVGNSIAWTGSLADLAAIEARFQAEQAKEAGRAFPTGAPTLSPWNGLIRCQEANRS